jgi:glutamine synthetase
MTNKHILEYIWLDSNNNFRSKVKVESQPVCCEYPVLCNLETWNYDGSSTGQATGHNSEVFIKPYMILEDFNNINAKYFFVFCECLNPDGTPHKTNTRRKAVEFFSKEEVKDLEPLFGIEQEFFVFKDGKPIVWNDEKTLPQGDYYCGNGGKSIHYHSRKFLDNVIRILNDWSINVTGYNYEVAPGQMEIQICEKGLLAADYLQVVRFILTRCAEEIGWDIILTPKPDFLNSNNWNGSGCHVNFSTKYMRTPYLCKPLFNLKKTAEIIGEMYINHTSDIALFGSENNKLRLSGINETSSYNTFTYGIANRGSSIRIPRSFVNSLSGYIEDRRPGADMDPYVVIKTICSYALLKTNEINSDDKKDDKKEKVNKIINEIISKHLEFEKEKEKED